MKIYISSTFEDLKDYRAKVYNQLRKLRQDVISMEDYVAGDQRPLAKCLEDIADCDIYVGIIAWRYGFVPTKENPSKLSITELEYRQAAKLKKQCLLFILDKNIAWQPQFMDSQSNKSGGKSINDFRNRLGERHTISWFTTADQLASDVVAAVYRVQFEARVLTAPNTSAEMIPEKKEAPKKVAPSKNTDSSKNTASSKKAAPSEKAAPLKMAAKQPGYPKLWKPGSLLHVKFLDGNARQKSLVKRFASIWSAYANISFQFDEDISGEVRVSFDEKDGGSWSYVGTDALVVAPDSQTVNFGWLNDKVQDTEAETVILKQFGHVLGLMNEHQNPTAKIPWNKEPVYKTYQDPPNSWSRKDVDHMMFETWNKNVYPVQKRFDPESIMFYRFPPEFTGGKIITPAEEGLSQGDKAFVALLYPFDYAKQNKKK